MNRLRAPAVLLLLLAGAAAGQDEPAAIDVHILKIWTEAGQLVPKAEVVAAKRIVLSDKESDRSVEARVGSMRLGAELRREEDGDLRLERQLGRTTVANSGKTRVLDLTDAWRWGRRPRHGAHFRGAILCEPADVRKPFVELDAAGFMQRLVPMLFENEGFDMIGRIENFTNIPVRAVRDVAPVHFSWDSPRWKAGLVLGSVPLDLYLEDSQIERILAAGDKIPNNLDDQSWPFLRPLIALSHPGALAALARRTDQGPRRAGMVLTPRLPRSVEDSVVVAYATETDPRMRGLAGWAATGTGSPDVFDMLAEDVRTGRAILPGSDEVRSQLAEHIVSVRAWQSVSAPLLMLAGSALAIGAIIVLMRLAVRRMF